MGEDIEPTDESAEITAPPPTHGRILWIMAILGIPPGPDVGAAYRFLLELRLTEGPLGEEEATRRLTQWHAER